MIDPRVALLFLAGYLAVMGVTKAVRDVKKGVKAVEHSFTHLIHHPVDSLKNGTIRK